MSVEEKRPFLEMAEQLKRQHHLDHPDYRFKPKQRSTTVHKSIVKKAATPLRRSPHSEPYIAASVTGASSSSSLFSSAIVASDHVNDAVGRHASSHSSVGFGDVPRGDLFHLGIGRNPRLVFQIDRTISAGDARAFANYSSIIVIVVASSRSNSNHQ